MDDLDRARIIKGVVQIITEGSDEVDWELTGIGIGLSIAVRHPEAVPLLRKAFDAVYKDSGDTMFADMIVAAAKLEAIS